MSTRKIIMGSAALAAVIVLALWASPDARDWAIAAIATLMALILRGADHTIGPVPSVLVGGLGLGLILGGCSGTAVVTDPEVSASVTADGDAVTAEVALAGSVGGTPGKIHLLAELGEQARMRGVISTRIYGLALAVTYDCVLAPPTCHVCGHIGPLFRCAVIP